MRFSAATVLLALPVLAAAESQFEQYKAQFQNLLGSFGSYIPSPNKHDAADAQSSKLGAKKMSVLTLDNWKDTLYGPVKVGSTKPEEWWVLITGRNKTCFGMSSHLLRDLMYVCAYVLTLVCDSRPLPPSRSRIQRDCG
jgi:hypothetical protein